MTGPEYRSRIRAHAARRNELHDALRSAFGFRANSPAHEEAWERAARVFHAFRSEVDDLCADCLRHGLTTPELRRFAFDFVGVDPRYFRSGYFLESLLLRIKKLELTAGEADILRQTILRRIDTRALRNFRHLCRMIPLLDTPAFRSEVQARRQSRDPAQRRRAEFALRYFPQNAADGPRQD